MTNSDRERAADCLTLQSLREVEKGLSAPIDDLVLMIDEDKNASVGRGRDEIHSGEGEIVVESVGKEITEHDQWFRKQVEEALENADGPEAHFEPYEQVRLRWAKT